MYSPFLPRRSEILSFLSTFFISGDDRSFPFFFGLFYSQAVEFLFFLL